MRNNFSVLNIYKKKNLKSEIVTQILYGDTFKILEKSSYWIKIKNDIDNYKGYIKNKKYPYNHKNTHKVFTLFANLYLKPKNSSKIKKKLSFASKISVTKKKNGFYKFDDFWIKQNTLKKIHYKNKNFFFWY